MSKRESAGKRGPDQFAAHLAAAAELAGVRALSVAPPHSRQVIAGRIRLHLLDWGGCHRAAIVLLHGGGLNAHAWDLVSLGLRDEAHVYALDLRGHGDSEWPRDVDYRLGSYCADIGHVVDGLGVDRVLVIGQSLGALTAVAFAQQGHSRLSGIGICDVAPVLKSDGVEKIHRFMELPSELDTVEEFVDRAIAFNPRRERQLLRTSLLHNLHQLPTGKWTWRYDPRRFSDPYAALAREEHARLWDAVDRIMCPTLVVRGAESDLVSHDAAVDLVASIPDAKLVEIVGAGHNVHGDNPAALVGAIREFAEEIGL